MPDIRIKSNSHTELIDITPQISSLLPAGMESGVCTAFSTHTTAGLTINENADPDVKKDIIFLLDKIAPWTNSIYKHGEGNSAAHVKASLMGLSVAIPVRNGKLRLGTWQCVYFCEFDGPRDRTVCIEFTAGDSGRK
ncbi:MAG TPA: hypothetical protein DCZ94_01675 [Lentisphaeria bacterium]|nr:MAG: hypothetical protein A2X48_21555 [Lentisphaerae bacterium GWF2_49_21]HBC85641.1 hypothetical protein [Lentisphaeria bacterium]